MHTPCGRERALAGVVKMKSIQSRVAAIAALFGSMMITAGCQVEGQQPQVQKPMPVPAVVPAVVPAKAKVVPPAVVKKKPPTYNVAPVPY